MGPKTRAYAVVLPVVVFVVLWVQVTAHMRLYLYVNCRVAVLTSVSAAVQSFSSLQWRCAKGAQPSL